MMARAAEKLGWAEEGVAKRICDCLARNALPITSDYSAEALAAAALRDKKRTGDTITIVVPEKIGRCVLKKIPVTDLQVVFAAGLEV